MTTTNTPAEWAINPSGDAFDQEHFDRFGIGGEKAPPIRVYPSEAEAIAAGEGFLRFYPPAGYGSTYRVQPARSGYGWNVITWRAASCD